MLGKVASAIGEAGGTIGAVDLVQVQGTHTVRDITVATADASDWPRLSDAVDAIPGAHVLDATDRTFLLHVGGKIELRNKSPIKTRDDLSMAYTPGVARICLVFHDDQHGTAVVVMAALFNALTLTGQRLEDIRIVISGVGAAGIAVARILLEAGARHIIGCDSRGALHVDRDDYLDGTMHAVKR